MDSLQPKKLLKGLRVQFKANLPLHRLGLPEEMASAAFLLAQKESSYRIDLRVDGGLVPV
jgi:NAD(P)-dependent dehydrogenase (short-subunit alcohol dehydrogenase family)